ncbi:MAG: Acetyltransferase, family [Armatimonadetes bacterium]|nr:Acetyltransferase, family [Armatimonadota bacterium]
MSDIRFRPATKADDAFFREIELETTWTSLDAVDQQRFRRADVRDALRHTHELLLQRPGNQIVVAEDEAGDRVGLLWFGVNRNLITGEDEAWVYNVTVVPAHRRKGIGRKLIEHAEEMARAGGFTILGLMVSAHNEAARTLYENLSFESTNHLMRKRLT